MCDEYEDERMVAFWRKLEAMDRQETVSPEDEQVAEPLVRIAPDPATAPKPKPKTLAH